MKLFALIPALALSLVACGGANKPAASSPAVSVASTTSADIKAPGEAKIGDKTRCPVSGEVFVVDADSPHVDYAGKTYYFSCSCCVGKFKADPQKYLGKPGA